MECYSQILRITSDILDCAVLLLLLLQLLLSELHVNWLTNIPLHGPLQSPTQWHIVRSDWSVDPQLRARKTRAMHLGCFFWSNALFNHRTIRPMVLVHYSDVTVTFTRHSAHACRWKQAGLGSSEVLGRCGPESWRYKSVIVTQCIERHWRSAPRCAVQQH